MGNLELKLFERFMQENLWVRFTQPENSETFRGDMSAQWRAIPFRYFFLACFS